MKFAKVKTLVSMPNKDHPHALLDTSAMPANIKAEVLATISKARRNPESLNTALKITDEARGRDLWNKCLSELKAQKNKWASYALQMRDVGVGGRTEFLSLLVAHTKDMNAYVSAMKDTAAAVRYKKACASAKTELSKLKVVARALNAGYVLQTNAHRDDKGNVYEECAQPYDTIVSDCRIMTEATASNAGRPKTPAIVKVCQMARQATPVDEDDEEQQAILVAYLQATHPDAWAISAPKAAK